MSDIQQLQNVSVPPPTNDVAMRQWMRDVTDTLNSLPQISIFSSATPNSLVTAGPGSVAINLNPTSTATKIWLKETGFSHTGWVSMLTA